MATYRDLRPIFFGTMLYAKRTQDRLAMLHSTGVDSSKTASCHARTSLVMDDDRRARYRAILRRFEDKTLPHLAVLHSQLQHVEIVSEDADEDQSGGFVHVRVPQGVSRLPSLSDFPLSASYYDSDGMFIDILLHATDGYVDTLEWYRPAGKVIAWPPEDASHVEI